MNKYTPRKPAMEKATYDVKEVASLLNVSLPNAYAIARQNNFPAISIGRRIIIPRAAFHRWLEQAGSAGNE